MTVSIGRTIPLGFLPATALGRPRRTMVFPIEVVTCERQREARARDRSEDT